MNVGNEEKASLKGKLIHEGKEMLVIFLYLALFFCTFTAYRALVMHELGVSYFHYGFALLKALILAKVQAANPELAAALLNDDELKRL